MTTAQGWMSAVRTARWDDPVGIAYAFVAFDSDTVGEWELAITDSEWSVAWGELQDLVNVGERFASLLRGVHRLIPMVGPATTGAWANRDVFGERGPATGDAPLWHDAVSAALTGLSALMALATRGRAPASLVMTVMGPVVEIVPEMDGEDLVRRMLLEPVLTEALLLRELWAGVAERRTPPTVRAAASRRRELLVESFERMPRRSVPPSLGGARARILTDVLPWLALREVRRDASWLDFSDLEALGRLDRALGRTPQALALRFEKRTGELLASLGYAVVAAPTGAALPDAFLEVGGGDYILVDTKATAAPTGYDLPKADRRAIADYVVDASARLPGHCRVRAVMLVGPLATSGLGPKLAALERETGTPMRFVRTAQLAALREAHRVGERLVGLERALIDSPSVCADDWWEPAVRDAAHNQRLLDDLLLGRRR